MDNQHIPTQEPVNNTQPPEQPIAPAAHKPHNKKLHLLIAAAALLILGGSAFALTQLKSDEPEENTTAQNQEQSAQSNQPLAAQLMAKYPSGVIDIQSFECEPRTEDEWYRTDHTLAIDPKNPDVMYVSVEYLGVFKSTDGGTTWQEKTDGILAYARNDDKSKRCFSEYPTIRINPADSNHIVLITSGGGGGFLSLNEPNAQTGGIYQSFDAGESWTLATGDNMNIYATDAQFSADGSSIFYATSSNPASFTEADQTKTFVKSGLVLTTTDKAKTWTELPTGIGERTSVTNIHVNPANPLELVAPTFSAQRLSADGTGTGLSNGKDFTVPQLGILSSADGGKTWTTIPGSTTHAITTSAVAKQAFANQFFVISNDGSSDPFSYVTTDGGKTLKKTKALDTVAYDPHDTTGARALGFTSVSIGPDNQNLNLWESTDAGITWKKSGTLPSEITSPGNRKTRVSGIQWHPTEKNTVYLNGAGGHVWKSVDSGKTWTTLLSVDKINQ